MRQVISRKRLSLLLRIGAAVLMGLCFIPACKKKDEGNSIPVLTMRDKLLGTWRRNLRATDYNGNRIIDSADVLHAPATDTLMLTLVPDATYTRIQRFKGEDFQEHGTWHLQLNDQEIVLQPSTSTTRIDTLKLDTVSQEYFRYHVDTNVLWQWGAFVRP
jgi:hypothetical protein